MMIVEIIQDRKVLFEKFNKEVAIANYLINEIDGCFMEEVVVYERVHISKKELIRTESVKKRVYSKNEVALFEENGIDFIVKWSIWSSLKKEYNYDDIELSLVISMFLLEFFPENTFKVKTKGFIE